MILDGTATPIKTHELSEVSGNASRAILILRNPFDALRAEFKRQRVGKKGQITINTLTGEGCARILLFI